MGENSAIEWCDHTFNGWIGCTKVSPACDHCYAEVYGRRFGVEWGKGATRRLTSEANWKKPLAWNRRAAREGRRYSVFANSLSDWADPEVPDAWRDRLFALAAVTPNLDWLLLSKRPKVAARYLMRDAVDYAGRPMNAPGMGTRDAIRTVLVAQDAYEGQVGEWPLPNLWLGVTVENQKMADLRIPTLLKIPAAKRFLSVEPLLGPVDLVRGGFTFLNALKGPQGERYPAVDWVIVGGESGPKARPMHPDWVRSIRDQCRAAGVPFFFKQWGEWKPVMPSKTMAPDAQGPLVQRVGKKAAGRRLDGVEHAEVPA